MGAGVRELIQSAIAGHEAGRVLDGFRRENGQRRTLMEANVPGRDAGRFVAEARKRVEEAVKLPSINFRLIFLLLFATFHSVKQAALVFTIIPFAVTGGVLA